MLTPLMRPVRGEQHQGRQQTITKHNFVRYLALTRPSTHQAHGFGLMACVLVYKILKEHRLYGDTVSVLSEPALLRAQEQNPFKAL